MDRVPQGCVVGGLTQTFTTSAVSGFPIDIRNSELKDDAPVVRCGSRIWNIPLLRLRRRGAKSSIPAERRGGKVGPPLAVLAQRSYPRSLLMSFKN
jgi:hypothetical protein